MKWLIKLITFPAKFYYMRKMIKELDKQEKAILLHSMKTNPKRYNTNNWFESRLKKMVLKELKPKKETMVKKCNCGKNMVIELNNKSGMCHCDCGATIHIN